MGMASEVDRAYLAGIIDGEGCIHLGKREVAHPVRWSGRGRKPTSWARFDGKVHVVNTDMRLLEWLHARWPGRFITSRPPSPNQKGGVRCKPSHALYWGSRLAKPVLEEALPFLVLKREQAEILLAFIQTLGNRGTPLSVDTYRAREVMHARMAELNRKGIPDGSFLPLS